MKLKLFLTLALFSAAPAFASSTFLVDFENNWDFSNGGVDGYYSGGTAADGSSGPNLGVAFTGISGLSNDADFTYYQNAPTPLGTAYVFDDTAAYINVAAGVDNALSFFYSSTATVLGAVKAYSGLNGTGTLLGVFDLTANDAGNSTSTESQAYTTWNAVTFGFTGTALSFDLSASANIVGFDNISASAVPVPAAFWLLASGLAIAGGLNRRGGKIAA
ncbi:MAG: VPLPA-CTERM sorting domain-containing protein [Methylococcaceae bacterium]|jgi:hypothetical protein